MKKIASMLFAGTLAMTLVTPGLAAPPSTIPNNETAILDELHSDMKQSSNELIEIVQQSNETALEHNPKLQRKLEKINDIKKKHPKIYAKFVSQLDATNPAKYQEKLDKLELKDNDKKIVPFDDGSFIVASNQIQTVGATPLAPTTYASYYDGYTKSATHKVSIWGIYKAADLYLTTKYKIGYQFSSVSAIDATSTGSAIFPASIASMNGSIVTNYATAGGSIETKGVFYIRESLTGDFSIISREYSYVLRTKVTSNDTVTNTYQKY